jgi:hypothetical protein
MLPEALMSFEPLDFYRIEDRSSPKSASCARRHEFVDKSSCSSS